ncbi:hypothetical protein N7468_008764 [Penicillium chermesinum]|uniref:DUF7703 domain-containing protein n=1 Tax=Penicillium chermesinum TaxID=63820 RepID=A0A9W9TFF7_9EURO|nr:uncharacterized protein N7468_008764 [Penicillium chermesinum]KAJ5219560.1 hypothetical protein N7468_008764 [Penicillium chermesinum]KAJ6153580.1 hypothetical protein N7470_006539 [Penicillium chermesinum]
MRSQFSTALPPDVGLLIVRNMGIFETIAMFSIGAWNGLEVALKTFDYFKEYRGLYFWSMQVASWGIVMFAVPSQLLYISYGSELIATVFYEIGWCAMVTGQAVVLYSRLHLVVTDKRILRFVLCMIVTCALVFHVPMIALLSELRVQPANVHIVQGSIVYDCVEAVGFCVQDLIICAIYMRESIRALKPVLVVRGREGRRVIIHLLIVNMIVVVLNIALIIVVFMDSSLTASFKAVVYSIKLKLEFMILTRLRNLISSPSSTCHLPQYEKNSDNIHDMVDRHPRTRPSTKSPTVFIAESRTPCADSVPKSTFDFHQALKETTLPEHAAPWCDQQSQTSEGSIEGCSRPRIGSSDTSSTIEKQLLHS